MSSTYVVYSNLNYLNEFSIFIKTIFPCRLRISQFIYFTSSSNLIRITVARLEVPPRTPPLVTFSQCQSRSQIKEKGDSNHLE